VNGASPILPAGATVPTTAAAAAGQPLPAATVSLLPKPSQPVGSIESLYALMTEAGNQEQKNGKIDVEKKFVEKRQALEKYVRELQKSIEDKADGGGPFKTLAIVAMAVVAAAATVMTLGAAAPAVVAVGLALSASGFLVTETKCLDPILGDGVSKWVGLGLGIAGAVVTMGAGTGASAGSTLETVAKGAEGVSTVAQGCQTTSDAIQNYDADGHAEKAVAAQQQMRRIQVAIDDIIQRLGEAKDDSRRGAEAVNQMSVTADETLVLAAGGRA
jgi:hypothetical protein